MMHCRHRSSRLRFLLFGIALSSVVEGQTVFTWDGGLDSSYDGAWANALNWNTDVAAPGPLDTARFAVGQSYSVGITGHPGVDKVDIVAGDVRFDVQDLSELHIGNRLMVDNATLRVANGPVTAQDAYLQNAYIRLDGGHLKITGDNSPTRPAVESGTLQIDGYGTFEANLNGYLSSTNPNLAGSYIRADGGDLAIKFGATKSISGVEATSPANDPQRRWLGRVEVQGNELRFETGVSGSGGYQQRTLRLDGAVTLAGGRLVTNGPLIIDPLVVGFGIIEGEDIVLNDGAQLTGDLTLRWTGWTPGLGGIGSAPSQEADVLLPVTMMDVGNHKLTLETTLPEGQSIPSGRVLFSLAGGTVENDSLMRFLLPEWNWNRAGYTGYGLIRGPISLTNQISSSESHASDPSYLFHPTDAVGSIGNENVGAGSLTVLSNTPVAINGQVSLSGGSLRSTGGWTMGTGLITGAGVIYGSLPGAAGLSATGPLSAQTYFGGSVPTFWLSSDPVTMIAPTRNLNTVLSPLPVTMTGGLLWSPAGIVTDQVELRGAGELRGPLSGTGSLTLNGDFQIGDATASNGVDYYGNVTVGEHTLTLQDADVARLGGEVTSAGGAILASHGLSLGSYVGHGSVQSAITGGGIINATGPLTLGDTDADIGFLFDGTLNVGEHHVTLLGGNHTAFLGVVTTLAGGVLESPTGFSVDLGESISGQGIINGALLGTAGVAALNPTGGFDYSGALPLGAGIAWILADDFATFSGQVSMAGGSLFGSTGAGLQLASTGSLTGYGTVGLPFDATNGTVSIAGGTLGFLQGATFGATVTAGSGNVLRLGGGHAEFLATSITDLASLEMIAGTAHIATGANFTADNIAVSGGALEFAAGTIGNITNASLAVSGSGTVTLNGVGNLALPSSTTVSGDGTTAGTLTGSGDWSVGAGHNLTVDRGTISGTGGLTIASGAEFDVVGNGATLARDIDNLGITRLNSSVSLNIFLGGNATLTNFGSGVLRVLDEPRPEADRNYNSLRATGLDLINAGAMTIGALTPQSGNATRPWFFLDRSFANTGSLSLLQSATFVVDGAFANTGTITLANFSQLYALGGGTMQGALTLGPNPDSLAVFRGVTVHDTGSTFTGAGGFVSIEGGTLHTTGGVYTPSVNLELLDHPLLPDATGLGVGDGRWLRIAGSVPALPVLVASGGTLELMGGTNTSAITVEHGGAMRLGSIYSNPTNHTRPNEPNILNAVAGQPGRGDIDNHGTLTVVAGSVTGTGRVLNRVDGVVDAISDYGVTVQEMLLDVMNEGLLTLWTRDERSPYGENLDGIRFGNITNSGTTVLKATEVSADPYDDVSVRIGDYVQTAGTTTIETAGAGAQFLPYVQAGSFTILGGTVSASGRLVTPTVENAGIFQVGSSGFHLTGAFNNNSGGDLRVTGNLSTTGTFTLNSGSRLLLNGSAANITQNGSSLFAGDFTTPAGATVELQNRSLTNGATMTTQGTLIIGSGATMTRNGGYLDGSGEVRVASGGSLVLNGGFDGSGVGQINIEAGGSMNLPSRAYGIHRFNGRTITNDGTVMHTAAGLAMNAGTIITNNGTWSVALPGGGDVGGYITEGGQTQGGSFINNGTFNQNGANVLYFKNGPAFTNNGTVNVNSGLLRLQSQSTFSGTSVVNVASGSTLELRDGTNNIQSGARFQGAGTLSLGDGGTHNLNGDIYADNAAFWGGTLNGTHTLHGTWSMLSNGGSMATTGTTTIASDGTWNFLAGTNLRGRTFVNEGTVNQGTLNGTSGQIELSPDTLIQNHGTWNALSQGDLIVSQNTPKGGLFENYGTFNKTGTGTYTVSSGYGGPGFTNHGTVNVDAGTLTLNYATTFSGSSVVNIASGASLYMADGTNNAQSGARFQGAGTVSFGTGQHNLNGDIYADHATIGSGTLNGTHTLHGSWSLLYYPNIATAGTTTIASDGTWQFGAPTNNISNRSFVNDGAITHTDGALVLNASSTISNHGTWTESSGSTISSSGHLQGLIENTGTFIKTGANTTTIDHGSGPAFSNTGTVDVQQGTLQLNHKLVQHSGSTLTGGTWIVRNGATLREDYTTSYTTNQADVTLHGTGDYSPLNSISTNAGTLRLLDGKAWNTAVAFTNSGTLVVGTGSSFSTTSTFANSGTLDLSGAFSSAGLTNTGTIGGTGVITGNLVNAAVLSPGNSPGLLSVAGNLTLESASTLFMELGGLVEGVSFDSVHVSGLFTLAGSLDVVLIDGFSPSSGATFNLIDASTTSGVFSSINLPTLTAGLVWDTSALYSMGVLSVTGSAVPEPSTYAILAGLMALGLAVWRKRAARNN